MLGAWHRACDEGDLPNARYWYRKAGRAFTEDVAAEIAALGSELNT